MCWLRDAATAAADAATSALKLEIAMDPVVVVSSLLMSSWSCSAVGSAEEDRLGLGSSRLGPGLNSICGPETGVGITATGNASLLTSTP